MLCLGKAITGGYMTLAATMTTQRVAKTIQGASPGVFMHGPTFMANPLACSAAVASLDLLITNNWHKKVKTIEANLKDHLQRFIQLESVADVRVLGAIGVVEMKQPVDMKDIQPRFVEAGIWVRPFGRLVYIMPPYIIEAEELKALIQGMYSVLKTI
jgi:adenosylmethionine-8-amino-7-oxononanoate aminotransferase